MSLTGNQPVYQRAQYPITGVEARQMIGEGETHSLRIAGVREQAEKAAHSLANRVIPRAIPVRAGVSEAGNRTVDNFRIQFPDRLVSQTALGQSTGAEVLDKHIRSSEKSQQDIPAFILTNVECDAPLVPIETAKSRGVKSVAPTPKGISFSRLFNLDDIGAQIGQHRTGKWPGDIARHFDNTNSLKRVIHFITPDRRLASEYKNLTDDNRG